MVLLGLVYAPACWHQQETPWEALRTISTVGGCLRQLLASICNTVIPLKIVGSADSVILDLDCLWCKGTLANAC